MSALHVDSLWDEAKSGTRKLTATERRRVLVYLDEIGEEYTRVELAKTFQVNEKTIKADHDRILSDVAKDLTPEAQMMVVAHHMRDIDSLIVKARKALKLLEPGVIAERFYIETLLKLIKERRETLENVGVIRKELGNLNVQEEHWVATVDPGDGTLGVHPETQPPQ